MRLAAATLLSATILCASGCGDGSRPPEPVVTCSDGYVVDFSKPQDRDGCRDHGGAADPLRNTLDDAIEEALDDVPLDPPIAYMCHDGWRSNAVGQRGACSAHGGIARTVHADGTQFIVDGVDRGTIIKPDGSTVAPSDPSAGP